MRLIVQISTVVSIPKVLSQINDVASTIQNIAGPGTIVDAGKCGLLNHKWSNQPAFPVQVVDEKCLWGVEFVEC